MIEVLNSNGSWSLWQDKVQPANMPAVLYAALQVFTKARVNGRVIYVRED